MPVFCFKISLFALPRAQLWYTCGSSSSDKASRASLQKGDDSYAHNSIGFSGSLEGTYVEPCHRKNHGYIEHLEFITLTEYSLCQDCQINS
jgi:hypothetical protein